MFVISSSIIKIIKLNEGRELHIPFNKFSIKLINPLKNLFPLVVMEKLNKPTYDIDILAYKGKALRIVTRKRLNPTVPNDGHIILNSRKLRKIAKKIISSLSLSWLYDFDCMKDKNGNFKVIEINPRMSGSVSVPIEAGIPLLDDLISLVRSKRL